MLKRKVKSARVNMMKILFSSIKRETQNRGVNAQDAENAERILDRINGINRIPNLLLCIGEVGW